MCISVSIPIVMDPFGEFDIRTYILLSESNL